MPILFCSFELYLPYCHSLKEKRKVVKGLSERLRSRFKVAVSEVDYQDLWQRSRIGIVSIGPDRALLEQIGDRLLSESEKLLGGDVINHTIEILEHD